MRRNSLALLAAIAAVLAVGCEKKKTTGEGEAKPAGNNTPVAQGTAPAPAEGDTILLGEVGSLTGAQATFGISTQRGIELALNEANAQGGVKGKKLAVRVYDDQSKPEEAGNATTRLITQDKVKIILGEVASSNSLAMAEKAQAAKVPMITPSSTNPAVTQKGDYIFRVCFIDPFQGAVAAKFSRENLKANNAALLTDNKSAYSIGLAEVFEPKFTELGGKVVDKQSYSQGDTDFRSQLTAIKKAKPDVIYVPGYYSDVGIIAKQARELGIKAPLIGGDGWDSPKLFELGGSAIEGNYFSNHYATDNPAKETQNFISEYKKAYNETPDALAALGYDAARVAVDAMKRSKDLSPEAIRDAIAQTKDFPGAAGTITLDANRNPSKPAVVLQIADGKYKYVTTVNP